MKNCNQLQIYVNSLRLPGCALEENCFSSGHGAQDVENQPQLFIIKLADLQGSWRAALTVRKVRVHMERPKEVVSEGVASVTMETPDPRTLEMPGLLQFNQGQQQVRNEG